MYEVIVGNVGNVYRGGNQDQASATYHQYVWDSKNHSTGARCFGEDVVLFRGDGSILFEHYGHLTRKGE